MWESAKFVFCEHWSLCFYSCELCENEVIFFLKKKIYILRDEVNFYLNGSVNR